MYHRVDCMILGETDSPSDALNNQDISRCFNCGNPDHKVSACQVPFDRELVALSRQYHQFFHGDLPQWERFHSFESWKQQRLDWLEDFQPGQIKGELLRCALADSKEEWLKNICAWGYPPGWISDSDPRERVRASIWSERDMDLDLTETIKIFGEDDIVEEVPFRFDETHENENLTNVDVMKSLSRGSPLDEKHANVNSFERKTPMRRWATYPNSYFSSDFLVPYVLPQVTPQLPAWDNTSYMDTSTYLLQGNPYQNPYTSLY